jgi:Flp pilus assembly protein TadG
MRLLAKSSLSNNEGASAVEFALVLPAFLMLVVGGFYLAILGFTMSSMRYATQAAARCASVQTTVCTNNTTTAAYAASKFQGSGSATFTSSTATCGHLVSGTMIYGLATGITTINVPLTARACFP